MSPCELRNLAVSAHLLILFAIHLVDTSLFSPPCASHAQSWQSRRPSTWGRPPLPNLAKEWASRRGSCCVVVIIRRPNTRRSCSYWKRAGGYLLRVVCRQSCIVPWEEALFSGFDIIELEKKAPCPHACSIAAVLAFSFALSRLSSAPSSSGADDEDQEVTCAFCVCTLVS